MYNDIIKFKASLKTIKQIGIEAAKEYCDDVFCDDCDFYIGLKYAKYPDKLFCTIGLDKPLRTPI